MEQQALKNVNSCLNTNIYSNLETSHSKVLVYILIVVHFSTPLLIRHLWQLMTVVFLHWCLIRALPLTNANEPKIKNSQLLHVNIRLG